MLTKEMRKPAINTLSELYAKNYSLFNNMYGNVDFHSFFLILADLNGESESVAFQNHNKYAINIGLVDFYSYLTSIYKNSSSKMAFIGTKSTLQPISMRLNFKMWAYYKDEVMKVAQPIANRLLPKLGQNIVSFPVTFGVTKGSFMIKFANQIIPWFLQAGIIQHLQTYDKVETIYDIEESQILTLEDLDFGFVIWLVTCGLAIIAFVFETSLSYFVHNAHKMFTFGKNTVMFLFVLKKRLRQGFL
jgi:hypothetical protein